jgi:acyl-coenzyme A synthetase/AMP-(fatty) acid ligase
METRRPLFALLADRVRGNADAVAVIYRGKEISYLTLATGALKLANALQAQGIKAGDRVGFAFSSSPLAIMLLFALARLGVCVVPLSLMRDASSRTEIAKKFELQLMIAEGANARLPALASLEVQSVTISTQDLAQTRELLTQVGAQDYQHLTSAPWFVVLSSGSTGVPKGVALTQAQAWVRIDQSTLSWNEHTRLLPYDLAIGAGLFPVLRTLHAGGTVIITEDSDFSGGFAEFATRHRATHVMSSPWMAAQLLEQLDDTPLQMPTVQYLWIAGGHCARHVLEGLLHKATPNVWVKYAAAETGVVASGRAEDLLQTPGLAGKIGDWIDAMVVDEAGHALAEGSVGLLRLRAPGWPEAYADAQDNAEGAFIDGWYTSKDYVQILPGRQLVVQGRAEGMVNVAGLRLPGEHFEELLMARLGLRECAVFSSLLPDGTNRLVVAVLREDMQHKEAVLELMKAQLDRALVAQLDVLAVSDIPRTPMGKVARRKLQEMHLADVKELKYV